MAPRLNTSLPGWLYLAEAFCNVLANGTNPIRDIVSATWLPNIIVEYAICMQDDMLTHKIDNPMNLTPITNKLVSTNKPFSAHIVSSRLFNNVVVDSGQQKLRMDGGMFDLMLVRCASNAEVVMCILLFRLVGSVVEESILISFFSIL